MALSHAKLVRACSCSALKRRSFSASQQLTAADIARFRDILGPKDVVTDADELTGFNTDWLNKYRGCSKVALLPRTTAHVSSILAYCNERRLSVVPQGGKTGLVGGSVPAADEVVLSLRKLDRIEALDETSGVLVCQAGVILEHADNWLAPRGFMMPWDLGAKGSCHIGGNISTNAGGLRVVRYGSLRGSILGLEVVLADGTVMDLMSACRKDNTGYDLKQLFIGSEGTLGVVTRCAIALPRRPAAVNVALLALDSFQDVCQAYQLARERLGEILSAVELLDDASFRAGAAAAAPAAAAAGRPPPLPGRRPFYLLLETSGSDAAHDAEKLERFVEAAAEIGGGGGGGSSGYEQGTDGVVAQSAAQAAALWAVREHVPVATAALGPNLKYDVSLPLGCFYDLVEAVRERLAYQPASVFGYGHLGDGNLHVNVAVPRPLPAEAAAAAAAGAAAAAAVEAAGGPGPERAAEQAVVATLEGLLEPWVFEWVVARGGSISAEHGIGRFKRPYLPLQKPPRVLAAMAALKGLWDPRGILNPGKVLPGPDLL